MCNAAYRMLWKLVGENHDLDGRMTGRANPSPWDHFLQPIALVVGEDAAGTRVPSIKSVECTYLPRRRGSDPRPRVWYQDDWRLQGEARQRRARARRGGLGLWSRPSLSLLLAFDAKHSGVDRPLPPPFFRQHNSFPSPSLSRGGSVGALPLSVMSLWAPPILPPSTLLLLPQSLASRQHAH